MAKKIILLAVFFLTIAVILGSLGAHTFQTKISAAKLEIFKTGVTYQFYHGIALILLSVLMEVFKKQGLKYAALLFTIGILFFSGSIYVLSTTEISGINAKPFGPITPLGGLFFISGWILTFIQFLKKSK
jgi:uncharacterized membrane protein YgdD (TMEM256/DUF423 family)